MRWHIIGGILLAILGVANTVMGHLHLGMMLYYNVQHGPIEFSNDEYETLDQIALTWQNVISGCCVFLAGIAGSASAILWFKAKTRPAIVLTALFFMLLAAGTLLIQRA